jgi:NADH:ubiquinone oxidoreductase subunit D
LIERNYDPPPPPHPDRSDYVPTITQESSSVHAIERFIGRVGYIHPSTRRTLSLEFYRIPNHCLAITTHAIDTGFIKEYYWVCIMEDYIVIFNPSIIPAVYLFEATITPLI